MYRRYLLAAALFALIAVLGSCIRGGGVRAEERPKPPTAERHSMDDVWEFQARVICDWPKIPAFEVEGASTTGTYTVVAVLGADEDPAEALKFAANGAAAEKGVRAFWAAPDAATQAKAVAAAVPGISGAVAPEVGAALAYTPPGGTPVAIPLRPAVLVLSPEGNALHAHFPGSAWDPDLVAWELRTILRRRAQDRGEFRLPAAIIPAPRAAFQGALACAACHRAEFKDWLMTPHSAALEDLVTIGRDADPECIGCHVVGWKQETGYSDRARHRHLADVQCESCHLPSRTHSDKGRMSRDEYFTGCATCHTTRFSLFSDFHAAARFVAHPQRVAAEFVKYDDRRKHIGVAKDQMYNDLCGKTEYVGSAVCATCHEKAHAHWAGTPHAEAFRKLPADKRTDETCLKCHSTGFGLKGGHVSQEETPGRDHVGCESCHGPGKKHVEALSLEERKATVLAFDEKCPTCVVQRICLGCHDATKRPCKDPANEVPFELVPMMEKVRHSKK